MKRTALMGAAALLALSPLPAQTTLLSDSFTGENGGNSQLNYASFANWTVNGAVDLIRNGDFGINCVGNSGSCVDMDGSRNTPGGLLSKTAFSFSAGDRVVISFMASGNQRSATNDLLQMSLNFSTATTFSSYTTVIAGATTTFTTPQAFGFGYQNGGTLFGTDPFSLWVLDFTAANAGSFTLLLDTTSGDNIGPIVDDISVVRYDATSVVPEPATWTLMLSGLGILGVAARRRRTT